MQWTKELKIAIVQEDELKIEKIVSELPQFDSLEQMDEAAHLIKEAHKLLSEKKEELASKLIKIRKQKEFLNSTATRKTSYNQSH